MVEPGESAALEQFYQNVAYCLHNASYDPDTALEDFTKPPGAKGAVGDVADSVLGAVTFLYPESNKKSDGEKPKEVDRAQRLDEIIERRGQVEDLDESDAAALIELISSTGDSVKQKIARLTLLRFPEVSMPVLERAAASEYPNITEHAKGLLKPIQLEVGKRVLVGTTKIAGLGTYSEPWVEDLYERLSEEEKKSPGMNSAKKLLKLAIHGERASFHDQLEKLPKETAAEVEAAMNKLLRRIDLGVAIVNLNMNKGILFERNFSKPSFYHLDSFEFGRQRLDKERYELLLWESQRRTR